MHELFKLIPEAWQPLLEEQRENLEKIHKGIGVSEFIPHEERLFSALELPPQAIKVVILGQDPYPNPLHAMGLSFSVPRNIEVLPPTLRNIFTELRADTGITNVSGDLTTWRDQGVLLLNRILTTAPDESMAHHNIGWEAFTNAVLKIASREEPVAILWGRKAQESADLFAPERTLMTPHPSPLSSYRGFFGSKPFSFANRKLEESGLTGINWQTD